MQPTMDSWKNNPISQQPQYADYTKLNQVLLDLSKRPTLTSLSEVHNCLGAMVQVQQRQSFILHVGDCVERFDECFEENIIKKYEFYVELAEMTAKLISRPVVIIARIAGQYAKPRSKSHEKAHGSAIPVFRGEAINSFSPDESSRSADPSRLLKTYDYSKRTIDILKDFSSGRNYKYGRNFFISHEGLLLNYEAALSKVIDNELVDLSSHLLWIGDRTRQLDGAHLAFFKNTTNPLAVKLGPSIKINEVVEICNILSPENNPGRLTFITRLGSETVTKMLPSLLQAVKSQKKNVLWSVDPMHANSFVLDGGIKTRSVALISHELRKSIFIHKELGTVLSGLHLEVTPNDVTECLGTDQTSFDKIRSNYTSYCDPRLNPLQSKEVLQALLP